MTDELQEEDDLEDSTRKVEPTETVTPMLAQAETKNLPAKARVGTVERIMLIGCTTIEEAYRTSEMFCLAGMVPRGFEVTDTKNDPINWPATKSRMTVAIIAGSEVGFGPSASLKNICVIYGLATIFGQGAKALIQHAGTLEWEKIETHGKWADEDFSISVSLKRRGQSEPHTRTFGKKDAISTGLLGRAKPSSPWKMYPERQTYWRAWTWCARDGFADALMGLTIAEELEDFATIEATRTKTDTSDLEDAPALPQPTGETNAAK